MKDVYSPYQYGVFRLPVLSIKALRAAYCNKNFFSRLITNEKFQMAVLLSSVNFLKEINSLKKIEKKEKVERYEITLYKPVVHLAQINF